MMNDTRKLLRSANIADRSGRKDIAMLKFNAAVIACKLDAPELWGHIAAWRDEYRRKVYEPSRNVHRRG